MGVDWWSCLSVKSSGESNYINKCSELCYFNLAFVLPIVSSLVKYLAKKETKAAAEQGTVKTCIKNFYATLSLELKKKFGLDPITPVSIFPWLLH